MADRPGKPDKKAREGRIARHVRVAREVHAEPRRIVSLVREALLNIWRARGGGFYGLGYLIAFLVLEARMLVGDVGESATVAGFVSSQIAEYVFRFTFMSFVNFFLAMIWPLYLLEMLGVWGFAVLGGGYLVFEKVLRPEVEAWFPELRVEEPPADEEVATGPETETDQNSE